MGRTNLWLSKMYEAHTHTYMNIPIIYIIYIQITVHLCICNNNIYIYTHAYIIYIYNIIYCYIVSLCPCYLPFLGFRRHQFPVVAMAQATLMDVLADKSLSFLDQWQSHLLDLSLKASKKAETSEENHRGTVNNLMLVYILFLSQMLFVQTWRYLFISIQRCFSAGCSTLGRYLDSSLQAQTASPYIGWFRWVNWFSIGVVPSNMGVNEVGTWFLDRRKFRSKTSDNMDR